MNTGQPMLQRTAILLLAALLFLPALAGADEARLSRVWTTSGFATPESVLLDAESGYAYVTNNGNGTISRLKLSGEMETQTWVSGLTSPKGMAVLNGVLYVADGLNVQAVNLTTKAVTAIAVPGATALNDIAVKGSDLYVSDSRSDAVIIHRLPNAASPAQFASLTGYVRANGLAAGSSALAVGCAKSSGEGAVISISYANPAAAPALVASDADWGDVDGLAGDNADGYFLTARSKENARRFSIFHVPSGGSPSSLRSQTVDSGQSGYADLSYLHSKKRLAVATFSQNTVEGFSVQSTEEEGCVANPNAGFHLDGLTLLLGAGLALTLRQRRAKAA